jgi:hypothetical protein
VYRGPLPLIRVSFVLYTPRQHTKTGCRDLNRDSSILRAQEIWSYREASLSTCPIQGPLSLIAASIDAIRKVRSKSTRYVGLPGTKVARGVALTRSKLLSGAVAPGATLPYSLWQLCHGLRAFPGGPSRTVLRPTCQKHTNASTTCGNSVPVKRAARSHVLGSQLYAPDLREPRECAVAHRRFGA